MVEWELSSYQLIIRFLIKKIVTLIGEIRKAYRVGENIKTNDYEKLKKTFEK